MSLSGKQELRIGDWRVDPAAGTISRAGETVRVEERSMRLLLELAAHPGEVVSIDELLERVWAGVIVTPDSVYQAVASLRRQLGDDPRESRYIANVPRLGYRMVAEVAPWDEAKPPVRRSYTTAGVLTAASVCVLAFAYVMTRPAMIPAPTPVGVLAFLDLTPSMDQEALADDVTEGLIDRLSKNPQIRTPGFRSVFLLKGKHHSVAEAASLLRVTYVVEGSIRKEGANVRVAARLVRADNGYVIWSQNYDRPLKAVPNIDDAMAQGVATAVAHLPPN
jgi:TolB-like protein/DNA-binding winged helix-turn-helix (wHTH) protein